MRIRTMFIMSQSCFPLNLGEYIKCYKYSEGYYLDNNLYKKYHNSSELNITNKTQCIISVSQNGTLEYLNEIIKLIQECIINGLGFTSIDNGEDFIVLTPRLTYTITSTENQKKTNNW